MCKHSFLFSLFLFSDTLRQMGKYKSLNFHTSTRQIHVVCQLHPMLPLHQPLALLLPGAWARQPDLTQSVFSNGMVGGYGKPRRLSVGPVGLVVRYIYQTSVRSGIVGTFLVSSR